MPLSCGLQIEDHYDDTHLLWLSQRFDDVIEPTGDIFHHRVPDREELFDPLVADHVCFSRLSLLLVFSHTD